MNSEYRLRISVWLLLFTMIIDSLTFSSFTLITNMVMLLKWHCICAALFGQRAILNDFLLSFFIANG